MREKRKKEKRSFRGEKQGSFSVGERTEGGRSSFFGRGGGGEITTGRQRKQRGDGYSG